MNSKKWDREIDSWLLFRSHLIKRTAPRRIILRIFQKADRPLSAEDIFSISKSYQPEKPIGLATIYRTLLVLEKIKFIHKVTPENVGATEISAKSMKKDTIYYEI